MSPTARTSKAEAEFRARYREATDGGNASEFMKEETWGDADKALRADGYAFVQAYQYTAPDGQLVYQSLRYHHTLVPGAKVFIQRRPGERPDAWIYKAGSVRIPYRWSDIVAKPDAPVFWCEGEKDADRLASFRLVATTAAGQVWSKIIVKALAGRDVVILEDNDAPGRKNSTQAVAELQGSARSLKIIRLPDLKEGGDVSDWLDAGHTIDEFKKIVADTPLIDELDPFPPPNFDPRKLPRREWLYAPAYIRGYVSLTVGAGGGGKSNVVIAEALAMASGLALFDVKVEKPLRVYYLNLEDDKAELDRRFAAAKLHYDPDQKMNLEGQLFVVSGRDKPVVIAEPDRRGVVKLNEGCIIGLIKSLRKNGIDVFVIDPFISAHRVSENDNGGIDLVAKALGRVAEEANCSIMLVHHVRKGKSNGDRGTVDDGRGASSLLAAARYARLLEKMTKQEAEGAGIEENERWRYLRSDNSVGVGKGNLAPPAAATWIKLETVDLRNNNDDEFGIEGDRVGVAVPWKYPARVGLNSSLHHVRRMQEILNSTGPLPRKSTAARWVGYKIAEVLGVKITKDKNAAARKGRKEVDDVLASWIEQGWFEVEMQKNADHKLQPMLVVGEIPPVEPVAERYELVDD